MTSERCHGAVPLCSRPHRETTLPCAAGAADGERRSAALSSTRCVLGSVTLEELLMGSQSARPQPRTLHSERRCQGRDVSAVFREVRGAQQRAHHWESIFGSSRSHSWLASHLAETCFHVLCIFMLRLRSFCRAYVLKRDSANDITITQMLKCGIGSSWACWLCGIGGCVDGMNGLRD